MYSYVHVKCPSPDQAGRVEPPTRTGTAFKPPYWHDWHDWLAGMLANFRRMKPCIEAYSKSTKQDYLPTLRTAQPGQREVFSLLLPSTTNRERPFQPIAVGTLI